MVCGVSMEEIWDEDLILVVLVIRMGEDVGALKSLRGKPKDVVDD